MTAVDVAHVDYIKWILGGVCAANVFIIGFIIKMNREIGVVMNRTNTLFKEKIGRVKAVDLIDDKMVTVLSDYKRGQEECKAGHKTIVEALSDLNVAVNALNTAVAVLKVQVPPHNQ